jgi:hypothetical protein
MGRIEPTRGEGSCAAGIGFFLLATEATTQRRVTFAGGSAFSAVVGAGQGARKSGINKIGHQQL